MNKFNVGDKVKIHADLTWNTKDAVFANRDFIDYWENNPATIKGTYGHIGGIMCYYLDLDTGPYIGRFRFLEKDVSMWERQRPKLVPDDVAL